MHKNSWPNKDLAINRWAELALRLVALAFVSLFALAVWFVVAGYVASTLQFVDAAEFSLKWAISGSAGSAAAAAVASPFLAILFTRRQWIAALFVVAPLVIVNGSASLSVAGAYLVGLYFGLLVGGTWLTSRVLNAV